MQRAFGLLVLSALFVICAASGTSTEPDQEQSRGDQLSEYLAAGMDALKAGWYTRALRSFSQAERLSDGRSKTALQGLATAHMHLDDFEQARLYAERVREMAAAPEEEANAENLLGTILYKDCVSSNRIGEQRASLLADAEAHFESALDLSDGQLAEAWLNLSIVQRRQLRYVDALRTAEEYLAREPEDRSARTHLCLLQYFISGFETASDTAADPHPDRPDTIRTEKKTPIRVEGDVLPPRRLVASSPVYTAAARKERVQGVVILEAVINENGFVEDVEIFKGLPLGLNEQAVQAMCQWQFEPATLNGVPVAVYINMTMKYHFGEGK